MLGTFIRSILLALSSGPRSCKVRARTSDITWKSFQLSVRMAVSPAKTEFLHPTCNPWGSFYIKNKDSNDCVSPENVRKHVLQQYARTEPASESTRTRRIDTLATQTTDCMHLSTVHAPQHHTGQERPGA